MKAEKKNASAQENKPKTKYDRKMEARRLQEQRDRRNAKLAKVTVNVIVAAVIIVAVALLANSVIKRNQALKDTYIKVGDHELTQLEYDFYYNNYLNQFLNSYASILPYMGLDTTKDFAKQEYTDGMTWKDLFDQNAVNMIISTKSLYDDAVANGFVYDITADYEDYAAYITEGAQSEGVSEAKYIRLMYGDYATAANVKPFVEESLISEAHYNQLLEDNKPSEDEITAYYEENKNNYDQASYYSFTITADTSEDAGENAVTFEQAEEKAAQMKERLEAGEDFETLCLEYATEDQKANYESADSEYSLTTGVTYNSVNSNFRDWIYEDSRTEGEVTVFENSDTQTCYVVKFVSVDYDEGCRDTISDSLASTAVEEYASALAESYEVTDVKGKLAYLKAQDTVEEESTDDTAAQTEEESSVGDESTAQAQ